MTEIIEKTYALLDTLDNSDLIKDLTKYKNKLMHNNAILTKIDNLKKETDNNKIISLRKELFSNNDYKMYQQSYNELSLIIMKINKKYKEYTNTKEHNCN